MKNNNGLKGATDAMHYCKSMMKSKGGSMMQPIKKYQAGGMTGDPGDGNDPTKKRKCKMGECGGSGGGRIKSFISNIFSSDKGMTTSRRNKGFKNKPSLKRHRL
jgi:hypothetical protein